MPHAASAAPAPDRRVPWWRSEAACAGLLVLAIFVTYAAAWSAGFIWDDDAHLTANACIVGPLGLKQIWTTAAADYFPLVLTNFWVQHALWDLRPLPYHLVNVAWHALNAVLLALVLRRLRIPGAWFGAALWALHPVQVESVAWISELKNTQSAAFYLLAALCYLGWLDAPAGRARVRPYALLLLCALAALLSKPSTVMLPVALLLAGWWRDRAWSWRRVAWLTPLFALSGGAAAWTVWEQKFHSLALGPDWNQSFAQRAAIAGKAVWFYLGKLAWPHPVMFIYPRWPVHAGPADFVPLVALITVAAALWLLRGRGTHGAFFAFAYFVALLFPILGFFNVYFFRYSFVADHFQYLASMGPLAFVGAALATGARHRRLPRPAALALAATVLLGVATVAARHVRTFRDSATLWRTTLARNPSCWLADTILGDEAQAQGRYAEAESLLRRALALKPDSFEAHYDLGLTLVKLHRTQEGIAQYEQALHAKPDFAEAENNLGAALASTGRPAAAIPHYRRALRLNPRQPQTHFLLALALTLTGHASEAVPEYEAAIRLKPAYPEAQYALARTLEALGRRAEAIAHYEAAAREKPDYFDAHAHLAASLFLAGRLPEANREFETAIKLQPDNVDLRCDFATVLLGEANMPAAIAQYEAAIRADPKSATAHYNLAIVLRAEGHDAESAEHEREARRLRPDLPPLTK